ncbi:hypothetical protein M8C21_013364, partial [Ambrosia artemisiifolia]
GSEEHGYDYSVELTTSSRSFFDSELWCLAIPMGQSGQRGQPGIPEPSFLLDPLELTLGYTPCGPVNLVASNDTAVIFYNHFLIVTLCVMYYIKK